MLRSGYEVGCRLLCGCFAAASRLRCCGRPALHASLSLGCLQVAAKLLAGCCEAMVILRVAEAEVRIHTDIAWIGIRRIVVRKEHTCARRSGVTLQFVSHGCGCRRTRKHVRLYHVRPQVDSMHTRSSGLVLYYKAFCNVSWTWVCKTLWAQWFQT